MLEYLYGKKILLPENAKTAINFYKKNGYEIINNFLRGNFSKIGYVPPYIIDQIITLAKVAENMPTRKFDVMLGRLGAGVNKSNEIGSKNSYDSFVSFGMDGGSSISMSSVHYRRVLKGNESAIPIDMLINQNNGMAYAGHSEAEMLTLPFDYSVIDSKKESQFDTQVVMGKIKKKDIYQILSDRIIDLKKYYEEQGISLDGISELQSILEQRKNEKLELGISDLQFQDDKGIVREKSSEQKLKKVIDLSKKKSKFPGVSQVKSFVENTYKTFKDRFVNRKKDVENIER